MAERGCGLIGAIQAEVAGRQAVGIQTGGSERPPGNLQQPD